MIKCFYPGFAIPKHCCYLITLFAGYYQTAPLSPLSAHLPVYTCSLTLFLTCEPARRLSVASPPLQKKEIVASFRHPELQGVFQENFLRVQPHIFPKREGPAERDPSAVSVLAAGALRTSLEACPPALERPDRASQR